MTTNMELLMHQSVSLGELDCWQLLQRYFHLQCKVEKRLSRKCVKMINLIGEREKLIN